MEKDEKTSSNGIIGKLELTTKPSPTPLKAKITSCAVPQLILCDESSSIHCISYNTQLNHFLQKDNFIMLINYLTKIIDGNLTIIITETTKVFLTAPFNIPSAVLEKAQTLSLQTSTPVISIAEAKQSPKKRKVTIEGKVIQVSKIKKVKNDQIDLRKVTVKDTTDTIQVSLWKEHAHLSVHEGNLLTFNSLQTSTFQQKAVLSSTNTTTVEPSQNQDLQILSSGDEEEDNSETASLVAVQHIKKYPACRDKTCRLKKLMDNNVCPKCYTTYAEDTAKQAIVVTVGVMKDDTFLVYTLFTDTFQQLFPEIDFSKLQKDQIATLILKRLPFDIRYKTNQDIITEASVEE